MGEDGSPMIREYQHAESLHFLAVCFPDENCRSLRAHSGAVRLESMLISESRGIRYRPTLGADANFNVSTEPLNKEVDRVQDDKNKGDVDNRKAALSGDALAAQIRDRVRREHPMEGAATDASLKYYQDLEDTKQRSAPWDERNSWGFHTGDSMLMRSGYLLNLLGIFKGHFENAITPANKIYKQMDSFSRTYDANEH